MSRTKRHHKKQKIKNDTTSVGILDHKQNDLEKIIFWAICLVTATIPLILDFNVYQIFALPKAAVLKVFYSIIIIFWLLYKAITKIEIKDFLPAKSLAIPLLLFGLISIVSTIFSIDSWISLVGVYTRQSGLQEALTLLALFFVLCATLKNKKNIETIFLLLTIVGGIIGFYASIQFFGIDFFNIIKRPFQRSISTAGNSNLCGNILALIFPFGVYFIFKKDNKKIKTVAVVCVTLSVLGIIFAQARSTWMALFFSIAFGIIFISNTLQYKNKKNHQIRPFKYLLAFALFNIHFIVNSFIVEHINKVLSLIMAFLIYVVIYVCWRYQHLVSNIIIKRKNIVFGVIFFISFCLAFSLNHWGRPNSKIIKKYFTTFHLKKNPRYFLFRDAYKVIGDHFFWGTGIGTYRIAFMPYKSLKQEIREPKANYDSPHNTYLGIWGMQGVFAFIVYLTILALIIKGSIKALMRNDLDRENKLIYSIILTSIVSYMIWGIGSFDSNVTSPILFTIFAVFSVITYLNSNKKEKEIDPKKNYLLKIIFVTIIPFFIINIYISTRIYFADRFFAIGFQQRKIAKSLLQRNQKQRAKKLLAEAIKNTKKALDLNPNESFYALKLSHIYFDLYDITKEGHILQILDKVFNQAFWHPWSHGDIHVAIMRRELYENKIDSAITHAKKALEYIPYNSIVRSQLGFLYVKKRNPKLINMAKQNFNYALQVDRKNFISHLYLGEIYLKENKLEKALNHAQRAQALARNQKRDEVAKKLMDKIIRHTKKKSTPQ